VNGSGRTSKVFGRLDFRPDWDSLVRCILLRPGRMTGDAVAENSTPAYKSANGIRVQMATATRSKRTNSVSVRA
jgi:hypothetical protein